MQNYFMPKYDTLKCDRCGGTIITGQNPLHRDLTACDRCGKEFTLYKLSYDILVVNDKTGWLVPVTYKKG